MDRTWSLWGEEEIVKDPRWLLHGRRTPLLRSPVLMPSHIFKKRAALKEEEKRLGTKCLVKVISPSYKKKHVLLLHRSSAPCWLCESSKGKVIINTFCFFFTCRRRRNFGTAGPWTLEIGEREEKVIALQFSFLLLELYYASRGWWLRASRVLFAAAAVPSECVYILGAE